MKYLIPCLKLLCVFYDRSQFFICSYKVDIENIQTNSVTLKQLYARYNPQYVKGFLESRRLLEEAVNATSSLRGHAGGQIITAVEEVDGLKNSEVVTVVTSTDRQGGLYLWER